MSNTILNSGQPNQHQLEPILWSDVSYGIFVMDVLDEGQEFRFVAFNPAFARNSPIPVERLQNKTLAQVFPAATAAIYRQHYSQCAQSGDSIAFEEYFHHQNAETWWLLTVNPITDPAIGNQGIAQQLIVTVIDISLRGRQEIDRQRREALTASASMFRRLVEDAGDVVAVWGVDGNLTYLSPSFQSQFGYAPAEWLGRSFMPLVHPDDLEVFATAIQQVASTGKQYFGLKFQHRHRQGHWLWVSTNMAPVRDDCGHIIALQGILRDVTEAKQQEEAMVEQALRQTLLNHLSSQIRNSLDLTTVIQTALEAIHQILEPHYCTFAWGTVDQTPIVWHITQEIKPPADPSLLGDYTAPSDSQSELIKPVKTRSGRIGGIICSDKIPRDWTPSDLDLLNGVADQLAIAIDQAELYAESRAKSAKLKQAFQELQRSQAQMIQSEKMSSLGQLVAGIAHEINNPVNFIHGNIEPAGDYMNNLFGLIALYQATYPTATPEITAKISAIDLDFIRQDLPKILTSMQVGTERISDIVKSLRSFSRLDEADVKSVDLHEGIDSALMILESRLRVKPHRTAIQIIKHYGDLPLVECFAGQMNQVFMHILMNAIDALESLPSISPTITITTAMPASPDHVIVKIANNGPEIPETIRGRLFDPFFSTKPIGQGTGMGLSISYQIITEKHAGRLSFTSEPGQGTEFIIEIALKPLKLTQSKPAH
jgi:two-component system, NtrC family, sensor kinase